MAWCNVEIFAMFASMLAFCVLGMIWARARATPALVVAG
jgi:hypothetical protein